jgi:hydrogenase nickel incorporation protein HypA/HybF
MHELSIAQSIVEIIEQHVPENRRPDVRAVSVEVGDFSGVVPDTLLFAFEAIVSGTLLESARLDIRRVPVVLRCSDCGAEVEGPAPVFACTGCGGSRLRMISGSELQVREVELDDQAKEPS